MEQNGLQVFDFEGRQTRVAFKGEEPWWVAADVCDILNLGTEQIRRLDDDERGLLKTQTPGGKQDMSVISESGLYALIMRSHKPEAKKFRKWVTHEVLPSIRRHGAYMTPQKIEEATLNPDMLMPLVEALKKEQDALKAAQEKTAALEAQIERDKSKVSDGEDMQTSLNGREIIIWGQFTKITYLHENGLLLAWVDSDSNLRGTAGPSTTVKKDRSGAFYFEYGTTE